MLYGIQRLAELNPKSSGTRGIGGELPPHGWNRSEQEDNRGAAAQAASQPLSLAPACASPRVVLVTAGSWGFETSPCVATCGWNPLLLSPESCLRGQTQTEVRASLQVTHRAEERRLLGCTKHHRSWGCERGKREALFFCAVLLLACFLPAETYPLSQKVVLLVVWGRAVNHIAGRGRVPGFDWIPNQTGPIILFVSYSNTLESL